jgi:hypothetical protein
VATIFAKVSGLSETFRLRALDDPEFEAIYWAEPISDKIR